MSRYKKCLGDYGEEAALLYLHKQGYRIVKRNYRCKFGEVDLIAMDGLFLVFVEVKTRSTVFFGVPIEAVGYFKTTKMVKVASYYVHEHDIVSDIRFDVVGIIAEFRDGIFLIKSIECIKDVILETGS